MQKEDFLRPSTVVTILLLIILFVVLISGCSLLRCPTASKLPPPESMLQPLSMSVDRILMDETQRLSDIALSDAAQKAEWRGIKEQLTDGKKKRVGALYWYALPDGSYYTSDKDRVSANLRSRSYFSVVLAGHIVAGKSVIGKTSGRKSIIVAVPIKKGDEVTGVLGTSFYAEDFCYYLSTIVDLPAEYNFYAVNSEGVTIFNLKECDLTFDHPLEQNAPSFVDAMERILASSRGEVSYKWNGAFKKAIYQRSSVSGWTYVISIPVKS